ncbi:hypothetical protein B0H13DRAFT_2375077 [Mycena leptocephala]|nr:hypothetical protein B0H13DRAFT_2375077 [Mycena leptocephala]
MADWVDVEDPLFALRHLRRLGNLLKTPHSGLTTWNQLLPQLETPWLQYYERTHGRLRDTIPAIIQHECTASCEASSVSKIKCLYPTHIQYVTVSTCDCKPVPVLLMEHGVFPASPTRTKTGVAIDLLDLYRALFERSCDAITALAAALHTLYDRRGFRVLSGQKASEDEQASDPYRRLLIQAVQWAANLRDRLEKQPSSIPTSFINPTTAFIDSTTAFIDPTTTFVDSTTAAFVDPGRPSGPLKTLGPSSPDRDLPLPEVPIPEAPGPSPATVPSVLQSGGMGTAFGKRRGDVQFGADGCFSYRHLRKAGDGPISYDPSYFIPKHKVDAVGQRLEAAKKRPAAKAKPSESWDAANETKRKADPKRYDASGIFVMTCRHGQVIFLCNVDTPGEQQRYIVAMLEEVFTLLPPHATVLQAYDVGCVTEHSLNLHPIFPPAIRERVSFVINAMHAYGHHWACQLVYSPRFRAGIGLADHESVERFWSRIRKLIPLTRGQWNSRRIWMIDQYATFECRVPVQQLRAEWVAQKAAQTSIRAHAPARLRRELDKVLLLQNQIDSIDKAINDTKKTLHSSASRIPWLFFTAEELYTSLNIQKDFPELRDLPLESTFANAIGSFFEWESLDRAVSGRREALGTKLHQSTRKAISRRQPSLLKAIKKFNAGCETLERLRPPQCNIPIPLSVQLNGLRNDPSLHEDVWITPTGPIPRWLNDEDVRDGIRSLHIVDRCAEEVVRLNMERENLRRWLLEEQKVVERAIEMEQASPLTVLLQWRKDALANLERSWAPCLRFQDIESFCDPVDQLRDDLRHLHAPFTSTAPFDTSTAPFRAPTIPFAASATLKCSLLEEAEEAAVDAEADGYELDAGDISDEDQANLIEEVLHDSDDEEDDTATSAVEASADCLDMRWDYTPSDNVDISFIPDLATRNASLQVIMGDLSHFVVRPGLRPLEITRALGTIPSGDFSPTKATANQCAVFSISRVCATRVPTLTCGALPQLEHWVLVVVVVPTRELFFFDSMASRRGWRKDLRDVMVLITRLVALSNRNQHPCMYPQKIQAKGGLRTHFSLWYVTVLYSFPFYTPLIPPSFYFYQGHPRQTNGYDCGLWVLCMMAAIMRGYRDVHLSEDDMPWVRGVFRDHVQTLPFT